MVDDFGPDFDEDGQPLEEGESDRVKDEDERSRPGRTEEEEEAEREAEGEGEQAEKTVEKAEEEVAA
jgi:F-type H+-transporting ATPase subunit alpha